MSNWLRNYLSKVGSGATSVPASASYVTTIPENYCTLKEGAKIFVPLQTQGFGSSAVLCKFLKENVNVELRFSYRSLRNNCYVLADGETVVDLARIQDKMRTLAEISAPFVGTIFVEESDVIPSPPESFTTRRVLMG